MAHVHAGHAMGRKIVGYGVRDEVVPSLARAR